MSVNSYDELINHMGHNIQCVSYGDWRNPDNVAVECHDCHVVIVDFDHPATHKETAS